MSLLSKITGIDYKVKGSAPGKAIVIKTSSGAGQEREIEMFQPPGISSKPTENDRVIEFPVGSGVRVGIATHNYRVEIDQSDGDTIIYSTNADGSEIKAKISLDNAGKIFMEADGDLSVTTGGNIEIDSGGKISVMASNKISMANDLQSLKTLIDELIDNINAIITIGSPATQTVSPASQALFNVTKAKIDMLLEA